MAIGWVFVTLGLLAAVGGLPLQENSAASSEGEEQQINYRLPNNVKPLHYDIKLIPYMTDENFTYDGETDIYLEIQAATHDIILHTLELEIDEGSTKLVSDIDGTPSVYLPASHDYNHITQMLTIHFDSSLEPNLYTLSVKFIGILNEDLSGFFRCPYTDEDGSEMWIASSHFEPTSARRAFPCFDEPALKATFDISIQHYDNYTALSNMPVLSRTPVNGADEKVWTKFQTTPMMSTYLVAFVVADFANVSNADGTINIWARREVAEKGRFILGIAEKATAALEEYTNSSFRMPKMDHVGVTQFAAGAMENWGLIIYQEWSLLYDESMEIARKFRVAEVAVHELAHQWFGNVVSPSWWSYVWLNEGFAAYFQHYIMDKVIDNLNWMDNFVVSAEQITLEYDTSESVQPISVRVTTSRDAQKSFTAITYIKAASVLRMLSHFITEDVFRNGLIRYLDTHKYKAASPTDLWRALQSALDDSDVPHGDFTVEEVMNTWTEQNGFPLVTVNRDNETGAVTLRQEIFRPRNYRRRSDSEEDESGKNIGETGGLNKTKRKWWVPISYTTKTAADFSNSRPTVWMKPQEDTTTIEGIDVNDWIIVNLQESGYYRVNYDTANWHKIAKYLNSDNYAKIHPLNRAQILDDGYILVRANLLSPVIYMELTNYLSRESNIIPWIVMFRVWSRVETFLLHPAGADIFMPHLLGLMEALIETVGFEERPEENELVKLNRHIVMKWACQLGNPACRRRAAEKARAYIEDPELNPLKSNVKSYTLCEGLREANESMWYKVFETAIEKEDEELLEAIACMENPAIIEQVVHMLFEQNSTIPNENMLEILPSYLATNYAARDFIFDYGIKNWNTIVNAANSTHNGRFVWDKVLRSAYSTEQINKIRAFVGTHDMDFNQSALFRKALFIAGFENDMSMFRNWFQKS